MSEITKLETKEEKERRELRERIKKSALIFTLSVEELQLAGLSREEALQCGWTSED